MIFNVPSNPIWFGLHIVEFLSTLLAEYREAVQRMSWSFVPMSPGRNHYRTKSIKQSLWERKTASGRNRVRQRRDWEIQPLTKYWRKKKKNTKEDL